MPPWETVKSLLSFLVTDGVSDPEEQLEIGIFDISRAHFVPRADRELYIELPDEAKAPGDGDVIVRVHRSTYGFRDASNNWMREWQSFIQSQVCAVGKANLALFFNKQRNSTGAVHGDDFYVLQSGAQSITMAKPWHPSTRFVRAIDPDSEKHCTRTTVASNRISVLGASERRRLFRSSQIHDALN